MDGFRSADCEIGRRPAFSADSNSIAVRLPTSSGTGILAPRGRRQEESRMEIKEGVAAPDFSLAAHNTDQKVSLASFKGRPTVVAFMPFAFTSG